MTQPIGHGVPSAKAPTSADPMMPLPYCSEPTSADTDPARSAKLPSAPAIELATMKPVAEMNRNSGSTRPARPPQSVHAVSASSAPASAAPTVPARIRRSPPKRATSRALSWLVTMMPTMPAPNSSP